MTNKVNEHPLYYPTLPTETDRLNYRLMEVSLLKDQLKAEYDSHEGYYKKYRRAVTILDGVDAGANVAGVVLGGVGTGLLATLIAAPAVPPLWVSPLAAGCWVQAQR